MFVSLFVMADVAGMRNPTHCVVEAEQVAIALILPNSDCFEVEIRVWMMWSGGTESARRLLLKS